jgi:long-chain acyl-CoA synthetase
MQWTPGCSRTRPPTWVRTKMLLSDLIAQSAERYPEKTALIFPDERISFAALHRLSSQVAARLRKLGIGPRARVAILHENALAGVVFFWGILKSGAQVVDVPSLAGVRTILGTLAEAKPAALVASGRQLQRLATVNADCLPPIVLTGRTLREGIRGCDCHSLAEIASVEPSEVTRAQVEEQDVALIIYTSGTTGQPKGVMLSHRNLLSNIIAVNSLMGLTSEDSILVVVPLYFIHGRMQLLTHALIGGTMAFSAGFHFPQQIVDEMARYGVTGFSGVPYHFTMLLERTNLATMALPQLRYVVVTGGAIAPHALSKLSSVLLPEVAIHIGYGQTETSPRITNLAPSEVLSRPGSCGLPIPGVGVQVVEDDGSPLPPGAVGEVVVSGPNVMCGYVSGDEIVSGKIDQFGRLHTGDLGRFDRDGYLYLVGRNSELIKSAGERVFPREIEIVLDAHPAIRESAVLGIPDAVLGERIVACVVLHPGADVKTEDLRTHCLKSLPVVRVPREVRISDGLPKTGSGKTDRNRLAKHFDEIGLLRTYVS